VPEGQGPGLVLHRGDQHLAGVHGDPHGQRLADLGLEAGREAAQHHQQVEAGPDGPGGVVLGGHRVAEPDVDAVALVLGNQPAVALHHRSADVVVGAQDREVRLDVALPRQPGRPDHVAEHDRELAALAGLGLAPVVGGMGGHGIPPYPPVTGPRVLLPACTVSSHYRTCPEETSWRIPTTGTGR
jgi:hypothetical protein